MFCNKHVRPCSIEFLMILFYVSYLVIKFYHFWERAEQEHYNNENKHVEIKSGFVYLNPSLLT